MTTTVCASDVKIHQSENQTKSLVQGVHRDGGSASVLTKVTLTPANDRAESKPGWANIDMNRIWTT